MTSTDSLVFTSAFDVAGFVTVAGTTIWRSWYLPLGSNAPIGLTWKLEGLSFDDITGAVSAICSRSADSFVSLLEKQRDASVAWLAVATAAPAAIAVSIVPWATFQLALPDITTGTHPAPLDDPEPLGPVQDVITLYAWKHIVDRYLASPVARAVSFFTTYLDLIEAATPNNS
jgi:hypothetical protein